MHIPSYLIKKRFLLCWALLGLIGMIASCNNPSSEIKKKKEPPPVAVENKDSIVKGNFNDSSGITFDSNAIKKFLAARPEFKKYSGDFYNFYRTRHFNYVWYDHKGLIEAANSLVSTIEDKESDGVFGKIPYEDELLEITNFKDAEKDETKPGPDINKELLLTGQYFNYANVVVAGSANGKVEGWYLPRKKLSYSELLQNNIQNFGFSSGSNVIALRQYNGLKAALAKYVVLQKKGGETKIPEIKKAFKLRPGDSSAIVPLLVKRLHELFMLDSASYPAEAEGALIAAVNLFKQTHGLRPDSVINNSMVQELNIPAKKRMEQLVVNMERMRWIPTTLESSEFILVNIPEYRLTYYKDNKMVWGCNVVVGKPMTKTVIFSGDMQYVVFSPYWNVPTSIIKKEVEPGMRKNKNYLANHNMEWNGGKVRQKPGGKNSLGLVKFLFPNSNNIYLHDTPAKSLFGENSRAFSHGCIRVAKPRDLAILILKQDSTWTPEKIDAAMHAGKEKWVTLKKKIPVFIGYFTAFLDENGNLNFRPDVYQRDDSMLDIMMN